jgi:hypothetical protein
MKYLLLFLIFLVLMAWVGWRYRRQLTFAWQIWKMLRSAYTARNGQQTRAAPEQKNIPAGKLVRCEKCGTWIPKDTALNFGSNTYFCTAKCMEKSVVG